VAVELSDTLNPENNLVWQAQIIRTEGTLDANSLELFAIAKVNDPFGLLSGKTPLRIEQPVTASISGKILENVMVLPRLGVKRLNQVYLVDPNQLTLSTRTIEAVWSDANNILIRDPNIPVGTLLATTKLSYAPEGAQVEVMPTINPEDITRTDWDHKKGKIEKGLGGGGKKSGSL